MCESNEGSLDLDIDEWTGFLSCGGRERRTETLRFPELLRCEEGATCNDTPTPKSEFVQIAVRRVGVWVVIQTCDARWVGHSAQSPQSQCPTHLFSSLKIERTKNERKDSWNPSGVAPPPQLPQPRRTHSHRISSALFERALSLSLSVFAVSHRLLCRRRHSPSSSPPEDVPHASSPEDCRENGECEDGNGIALDEPCNTAEKQVKSNEECNRTGESMSNADEKVNKELKPPRVLEVYRLFFKFVFHLHNSFGIGIIIVHLIAIG
ncbi:tRNA (guanine(26)-N(2))-dimethyltransferase [Arachis hypogaea]|nr:tRNA (guanine(26)-N(2))-dimethyltransferase [Arachis hypogaea]